MSLIEGHMRQRWEDKAATEPGFAIALAIADLARAQYATSANLHEGSMAAVAVSQELASVAAAIGDVAREIGGSS